MNSNINSETTNMELESDNEEDGLALDKQNSEIQEEKGDNKEITVDTPDTKARTDSYARGTIAGTSSIEENENDINTSVHTDSELDDTTVGQSIFDKLDELTKWEMEVADCGPDRIGTYVDDRLGTLYNYFEKEDSKINAKFVAFATFAVNYTIWFGLFVAQAKANDDTSHEHCLGPLFGKFDVSTCSLVYLSYIYCAFVAISLILHLVFRCDWFQEKFHKYVSQLQYLYLLRCLTVTLAATFFSVQQASHKVLWGLFVMISVEAVLKIVLHFCKQDQCLIPSQVRSGEFSVILSNSTTALSTALLVLFQRNGNENDTALPLKLLKRSSIPSKSGSQSHVSVEIVSQSQAGSQQNELELNGGLILHEYRDYMGQWMQSEKMSTYSMYCHNTSFLLFRQAFMKFIKKPNVSNSLTKLGLSDAVRDSRVISFILIRPPIQQRMVLEKQENKKQEDHQTSSEQEHRKTFKKFAAHSNKMNSVRLPFVPESQPLKDQGRLF